MRIRHSNFFSGSPQLWLAGSLPANWQGLPLRVRKNAVFDLLRPLQFHKSLKASRFKNGKLDVLAFFSRRTGVNFSIKRRRETIDKRSSGHVLSRTLYKRIKGKRNKYAIASRSGNASLV